jgi:hypothetical protein
LCFVETLEVVADRGYHDGGEIRACEEADITVTLPKPMTSGAKAAGRFGKQAGYRDRLASKMLQARVELTVNRLQRPAYQDDRAPMLRSSSSK